MGCSYQIAQGWLLFAGLIRCQPLGRIPWLRWSLAQLMLFSWKLRAKHHDHFCSLDKQGIKFTQIFQPTSPEKACYSSLISFIIILPSSCPFQRSFGKLHIVMPNWPRRDRESICFLLFVKSRTSSFWKAIF